MTLTVAAKALCPCSKAISDRGAHNQRSFITATIRLAPGTDSPAIGRVIELLETSASSPLYPLLKREDEKFITETAYDNPAFVEDIVRNAAERLYDMPQVAWFSVESLNQESIHRHDCFARIICDKK
jgi:GTP cyclohydrolase I